MALSVTITSRGRASTVSTHTTLTGIEACRHAGAYTMASTCTLLRLRVKTINKDDLRGRFDYNGFVQYCQ